MIPKISLAAAFFLMAAPPMACASNRDATNPAPITCQAHDAPPGIVVAQDDQSNADNSDNAIDSNSVDSSDDDQNAAGDQTDQQNAAGDDQANPQEAPDATENDSDATPPSNALSQPVNPFQ